MQLVSEPAFTEEQVIDLDFMFLSGPHSLTLRKSDIMLDHPTHITVTTSNPPESFVIYKSQLLWYSYRNRTVRTPVIATHPSTGA